MKISGSVTCLNSPRLTSWLTKLCMLLMLLLVSGCMSHSLSSATALSSARHTLTEVQDIELQESALQLSDPDMTQARQLLNQAEQAQALKQTVIAIRLAERAKLIAELALAKAQLHRARLLNDELRTQINLLMLAKQPDNEVSHEH